MDVHPARLHAGRPQKGASECSAGRQQHAGIAHTVQAHPVAPLFGRALDPEGVLYRPVRLEHDALGFIADGFVWKHERRAMPPNALRAARKLCRVAGLYVLRQQVAGAWTGGDPQAHVQQHRPVFALYQHVHETAGVCRLQACSIVIYQAGIHALAHAASA